MSPLFPAGGGGGGVSGSSSFLEASGIDYSSGSGTPTDNEVVVYVQSPIDVTLGPLQPSLGSDNNTGLSKSSPLQTLDGVRRMVARRGIEGKRIRVRLAGGHASAVYPAHDPWDGQCTQVRYYQCRGVFLGGAEAFRNSWTFEGPWKMFPISGFDALAGMAIANVGLRTRWDTTTALGAANAHQGRYLQAITGNGNEAAFPAQITESSATQLFTDNGLNAPFGAGSVYEAGDTYRIVVPAAEIVGNGPGASLDGVCIVGWGAHKTGDITGSGSVTEDINITASFQRLGFERLRVMGVPGVSFDHCRIYNGMEVRGGWARYLGTIVQGGLLHAAGSRTLGPITAANEYRGNARLPTEAPWPAAAGDPEYPSRGSIELFVYGGRLAIGDRLASGQLNIVNGLSVRYNEAARGAIEVYGAGSWLEAEGTVLYVENTAAFGLWCRHGGRAKIDDAAGLVEIVAAAKGAGGGDLRVGKGNGIDIGAAIGDFREAVGWNGNFTRHLEGNATAPAGDTSRIHDVGWGG